MQLGLVASLPLAAALAAVIVQLVALSLAEGQIVAKKKFHEVYASELDKQTRELFGFGFKCRFVLDFSHPMCFKCCHHDGKFPTLGKLDSNCECVDDSDGKLAIEYANQLAALNPVPAVPAPPAPRAAGAPAPPAPSGRVSGAAPASKPGGGGGPAPKAPPPPPGGRVASPQPWPAPPSGRLGTAPPPVPPPPPPPPQG